MSFFLLFIASCLDTLPYVHLMFSPFSHSLRIKKSALYALSYISLTIAALGYALICYFHTPLVLENILLRFIPMLVLIVGAYIFSGEHYHKCTFWLGVLLPYYLVILALSTYLSPIIDGFMPLSPLAVGALTLVFHLISANYFKKLALLIREMNDKILWSRIFVVPLMLTLFMIFLIPDDFKTGGVNLHEVISCIFFFVCILFFSRLFFALARHERHHAQVEEERIYISSLLELQKQQYAELTRHIEYARKVRHDMRHHLRTVKGMYDRGDYERMGAYLEELESVGEAPSLINVCSNYTANALLSHYIDRAKAHGISVKVRFHLEENSWLRDSDLCVLLGNAVENAIEACLCVPEEERFIRIQCSENADRLYIVFGNSFSGEIVERDGIYYSRKREFKTHGVGVDSIRAIAKKYNGSVKIETEDKLFKLSVMLKKPEEDK